MLENEKKKYKVYRTVAQTAEAELVCEINLAMYMTSDRRDVDNSVGCVYLKKTYYGVCDSAELRAGDIVVKDGTRARIISTQADGAEMLLHLESVEIINTGACEIKEEANV